MGWLNGYPYTMGVITSDVASISIRSGGVTTLSSTTSTVTTNNWYYIVGTYDGTNLAIYFNGTQEDTNAGSLSNNNADAYLASAHGGYSTYEMDSQLDEVRMSNTKRADAWINYNYQIIQNENTFISIGGEEVENNATESEGDDAIVEGMNAALTGHTIYNDLQIIIANETNQSLGRYDRIAVDDDQIFPVNYVTTGESAENQESMGDFVWPYEITTSKTYWEIVTAVKNWITSKLN